MNPIKSSRKALMKMACMVLLGSVIGLLTSVSQGADIAGQWRAGFDSPVGLQKYLYTFESADGKLTGKATADIGGRTRQSELKDIKLAGDAISFVELASFQGNDLRIEYAGKLADHEMKLTRKVGDFGTEEIVAKRAQGTNVAASATSPNSTNAAAGERPRRGPGGFGGPIVLGPDDKAAFDDPPAGVNQIG